MKGTKHRERNAADRIPLSVDVTRYDGRTRREITLSLSGNGEWSWRKRREEIPEEAASGRLSPGILSDFLRVFLERPQLAADHVPLGRAEHGFWFVRIHADGALLKFCTGPVTAGGPPDLVRLDDVLERRLHLSGGIFTTSVPGEER